jgi:hypothetical protein
MCHGEGRLRIKLIGKDPLDQLSFLPTALGLGTQGRHLRAAFLSIEMKPGLAASQSLLPPTDGEMRVRLLERAVFDRSSISHHLV